MFQIKTLRQDTEANTYEIRLRFDNGLCSSSLDIWCQADVFKEFSKKLIDFPFDGHKTVKFEFGDDGKFWAYYLLFQIQVDDTGKVFIKTIVDNKETGEEHYRCEIPLKSEVATINELGKQLIKWTPTINEIWRFPFDT